MYAFSISNKVILSIILLFFHFNLISESVRIFEYDNNSQLIKEQQASGELIAYEYDSSGRIIRKRTSDDSVIEFDYDKNGNCISMTDCQGITSYTYDLLSRLTAVSFPGRNTIYYKYNILGNLEEMVYPNGMKVTYRYDSLNRLVTVRDQTGITSYEYDDTSDTIKKMILSNGAFTVYDYDQVKRISDVQHKRSDGTLILGFHYVFDANGNKTQIILENALGKKKIICEYDKLNRLTFIEYPEGYEKYTYDALGNRLTKETPRGKVSYEYDLGNKLIKAGDVEFYYDLKGNLIQKKSSSGIANFIYDSYDNLIEYKDDKHSVRYVYDGAGRRISKNIDGKVTKYINDVRTSNFQVLLKTTNENEIFASYTYGLSRLKEITSSGSDHYLYDYPGFSVVAELDDQQNIIARYQYGGFGDNLHIVPGSAGDFLYAGEAFEKESKLIYLRNRYYDPEIGRFISPDAEFRARSNPQSLNPYAYVNNNPINFVDPLGLRAARACGYLPGARTVHGVSSVGHGFWELTYDDGEVISIGRYPQEDGKSFKVNHDIVTPETYSYEWAATDEQIDEIIDSVQQGRYLGIKGNCIDGLSRGLDVLGVEHPSFKEYGVSLPTKAVMWLESLNGRAEYTNAFKRDLELIASDLDVDILAHYKKPKPPMATRKTGDIGGVSLNKTAKLLGHIPEIEGAAYDTPTGQLIMVGKKKNISLPEMDFDDLAVAVRSIYGLGGQAPQTPGVSLDPDPDHPINFDELLKEEKGRKKKRSKKKKKTPPPFLVRYEGQTRDTRFGEIMFEADRLLKCLSFGQDNNTGKEIKCKVHGYKTLIERYQDYPLELKRFNTRLWFMPGKMKIHKNRKGNAIVFKEASMKVLTETKFQNKQESNKAAEDFAEHFTRHYDEFAKKYPIFNELKRLAKITAIVKWMKDNKIPLDLTLFENYKPSYKQTPWNTPAIYIKNTERDDYYILHNQIVGGVIYHLDGSNFQEIVAEEDDPLSKAAIQARPSENVFKWTFISPIDSQEYEAVAQTVERTIKPGNVRKVRTDMRYPFEFMRYYNSFSENDVGFGRGWDVVASRIRFPREKLQLRWKNIDSPVSVYSDLFVELDGYETSFSLLGLGDDKKPRYKSSEEQAILIETNQGYALHTFEGIVATFSPEGKILSKVRHGIAEITYHYSGSNRIDEISHHTGKKIQLLYEKDRIIQASGTGQKCVQYHYNEEGFLSEVSDELGVIESYTYDADKNLERIVNARDITIFSATYDEYHRATSQTDLGTTENKQYSLSNHTVDVKKDTQGSFHSTYDGHYRLLEATDPNNRRVAMTYQEEWGKPTTIVDCMGNEKKYTYDSRGNIIRIVDAQGSEECYWYNQNNQLFAYQDRMGRAELYQYNPVGRLMRVFHVASIISEDVENGIPNFTYDQRFTSEYGYEQGHLIWVKKGGKIIQSFGYNQEGLVTEVKFPCGYIIKKDYDERGRLIKIWDLQDSCFKYAYDERDRLLSITSQDGMISYEYDNLNNLSVMMDANGGITRYSYNDFGDLVVMEDPEGGITTYKYDERRNLNEIVLANGTKREIRYDNMSRPVADIR